MNGYENISPMFHVTSLNESDCNIMDGNSEINDDKLIMNIKHDETDENDEMSDNDNNNNNNNSNNLSEESPIKIESNEIGNINNEETIDANSNNIGIESLKRNENPSTCHDSEPPTKKRKI